MDSTRRGVLLKGLPFSTTKADIKSFFKNISIHDSQITVILFRNKQSTGLAFVKLSSGELERALLSDRNHMGNRYVEVLASDDSELYELLYAARNGEVDARELNKIAGRRSNSAEWRDRSPVRKLFTKCAYIDGVPNGCTYRHVREFFKGCLIGRDCIHLLKEDGGNFRGDGYIEFGSEEECVKGFRRNGEQMRDSFVKVIPCAREEMYDVVGKVNGKEFEREDLRDTLRSRQVRLEEGGSGRRTPSPVRRRMKQYQATYRRQEQDHYDEHFREPPPRMPFEDEHLIHPHHEYPPPRQSRRDYGDSFGPEESYRHEPPRKDHPPMYPPHHVYIEHPPHRQEEHSQREPPHRPRHDEGPHRPDHRPEYRGYGPPDMQPEIGNGGHPPPQQHGGHERRIVRLEGLPYETSVRHIMEFFHEFRLEYEDIRIQCRDDGSPSGKAFVAFPSEKHARGAVASHDKQYILGRFVELFLL